MSWRRAARISVSRAVGWGRVWEKVWVSKGGVAHLQGHAASLELAGAQGVAAVLAELHEDGLELAPVAAVFLEGGLPADLFRSAVGFHVGAGLAARGALESGGALLAEAVYEPVGGGVGQLADAANAEGVERGAGLGACAGEFLDRERREVGALFAAGDAAVAVGLGFVGGDFGDELVSGDGNAAGEVELFADRVLDVRGDGVVAAEEAERAGDVDVGLVDGGHLRPAGETVSEDFVDARGTLAP
jgi:hypothetical protein